MKKIILIFAILLFSFGVQAQCITVSDIEYKNYISSSLISENNLKKQVNTALRGIELKNDEFIVLSGNLSQNNKLFNYKIKSLNISDEKANLIINRLNETNLAYNYIPDVYNPNIVYDQFYLYIGAKPRYELNKDFIVLLRLTNEKLKQDYEKYKKIMNVYDEILQSKLYPEFFKIKSEYKIPDDKSLKIQLTIDKQGNLLNSEIINSINPQIDSHIISAIKRLSPFGKLPSSYNFSEYKLILQLGIEDVISNKVMGNGTNTIITSNYYVIVKILLNEKGDVVSSQLAKSSNKNLIDKEILNAINMTNFIDLLTFDSRTKEFYLHITNSIQRKQFNISCNEINGKNKLMPFDWQPYMLKFQEQVKKYWNPPKSNNSNNVTTYILLNKDGQVINRSILKSSGDKKTDEAALKAIDDGVPYPKFPQEADRDVVGIQFTFDYVALTLDINLDKTNIKNLKEPSNYNYNDCGFWYCKQKYK